jgi:hypothetical protein
MGRCRSCAAEIRWVLTERGKPMPVDAAPYTGDDPRGLFVLRNPTDGTTSPTAIAVTPDAFPGEPVYRSHFATCPDRDDWRRS